MKKTNNQKRLLSAARATAKNLCYVNFVTPCNKFKMIEPVNFKSVSWAALTQRANSFLDQVKFNWHYASFVVWRNKSGEQFNTIRYDVPMFGTRAEAAAHAKDLVSYSLDKDMRQEYVLACGYIALPCGTDNKINDFGYIEVFEGVETVMQTRNIFKELNVDIDGIIALFDSSDLKTDWERSNEAS